MILARIASHARRSLSPRAAALAVMILSSTAGSGRAAEPGASPPAEPAVAPERVEEIVVRARRRDELLEETPVAVTAISETTLREAGVTRLDQIQQLVPNLQILTSDTNQEAQIKIRGVGTSAPEIAFDPGVGVYVDGVFLPRALGVLVDVLDIQQIEVLRGPQGTLFGKNTVGGAINITSVRPRDELEGFVLLRPGNLGSLTTRAMLNVPVSTGPLAGKVFSRFAFASNQSAGYDRNLLLGQTWSDLNSLALLGSLRFAPTDTLTLDLSGSWARNHSHGGGPQCVFVQDTPLQALYPGFPQACRASRPRAFEANVAQLTDTESYGTWGTLSWDAGDVGPVEDLALKYIGSWREQIPRLRMDNDGTAFPIVQISDVGGGPLDGAPGFQRQIQQEVQVGGRAWDRLDFVAGYFLFWEDAHDNRTVASSLGTIDFIVDNATQSDNWTWALFTQGTLEVTDWMSLTAGLRYTEDEKGLDQQNSYPTEPTRPPQTQGPRSAIFTAWTPMAGVSFLAPDDLLANYDLDSALAYFTFSRGFKGGGFNGVLNPESVNLNQFDPESLDSFEIGFKTVGWDRRLTLNLALFYGLYDDIQVITLLDVTQAGDPIPSQVQVTLNAAQAVSRGAEVELQVLPVDGLQLDGSVGLLDTRYDEFIGVSDLTGLPYDRSGETFNSAPRLQTHLAAQYSFPISLGDSPWLDGWLTPRLEWYYQSEVHFAGPEVAAASQPGYHQVHARLSYDFLDDRAQVALWSRNLTDATYARWAIASTVPSFGNATRYYAAPVTYGAELSWRF